MANRRFIDFPIATTVGDSDIILIWQSGVNKQTTKATFLSGLPENLDELNDVAISGLTNGQILRYDSVTGKWENTDQGNLDLNDLNDVSIVSPSNGQVLVYNSSTSKWENSSGGFVPYTGAVTTVNLGAQTIQAGQFVKAGGTASQFLKADGSIDSTAYGTGSVTSVGLTMPSAFSVANSPVTTAGTLAVTGAGTVSQYIRGDGSLADFPESSGGGSSVSYYLNGSVNQGTIGGVAYRELNKVPVLGAGTDFSINANGYIASFITDAGDPSLLEIPGGNWNFETYFSASSGGGSPTFYVELYKVSGTTATLIASNSGSPELIAFGTTLTSYFSTLAVPTTTLALTDRLAIRYYVTHSGRTITLHTEDNHLCQIITTFTTGLTALNGLTAQVQNFAVGTSGSDFNISSATATHTFNLPTASATNRGALSSADWTTFNNKQNALGFTPVPSTRTLTINGIGLDLSVDRSWTVGDMLLNTYQNVTGTKVFGTNRLIMDSDGSAQATSLSNTQTSNSALTSHNSFGFNGSNNIYFNKGTTANGGIFAFSNSATRTYTLKDASGTLAFTSDIPANPVGGSGTTNFLPKFTGSTTIGNSQIFDNGSQVGINEAVPSEGRLVVNNPNGSTNNGVSGNTLYLKAQTANANLIRFSGAIATDLIVGRFGNADAISIGTTGGTEIARFTSAGNVGINTQTPGAFLDINTGTATDILRFGASSRWGFRRENNDNRYVSFYRGLSSTPSAVWTVDGDNGNLGLGITPSARLHVNANDGLNEGIAAAIIRQGGSSGNNGIVVDVTNTPGIYVADFRIGNSSVARITNTGNLLVGTTTDNGARLQVSGTATFSSSVTASGSGSFMQADFFQTGSTPATSGGIRLGTQVAIRARNVANTGNIPLIESTATDAVAIASGGANVGIGTASPDSFNAAADNLVVGTTSGNNGITIVAQNNAFSCLFFADGTTGNDAFRGFIQYNHTSDNLEFGTAASGKMTLFSTGNLLVGTTTDNGARLQVIGNTYSEGLHIATGQFVQGASATNTFYTFSNTSINRVFLITLRQSGSAANNVVAIGFTYGGSLGAYNIIQDNTNPVLFLTISASGLGLRLTTGSGYGTTTWDWTITQLK